MYRQFSSEDAVNYQTVLTVYHHFAYYFCCIPYKIRRGPNGRYSKDQWWLQKLVCNFLSGLFIYLIAERFVTDIYALLKESKTSGGNNPYLYLRVFEACIYTNLVFVMVHTQYSKSDKIVKYLNKIERFSARHGSPYTGKPSTTRKFLYSPKFLKIGMTVITLVALSNSFISFNNLVFDYNQALRYARKVFLWQPTNNLTLPVQDQKKLSNTLFVAFYTFAYAIRGMKDMYSELFILSSMIPLWLISIDFSATISNKMASNGKQRNYVLQEENPVRLYMSVSRLSRMYSDAYGFALFWYLMNYLMWYAAELDVLLFKGQLGSKFYQAEYLSTFSLIYGCGAGFAYKMSSLQRLTSLRRISEELNQNGCIIVNFLFSRGFCDIKAKILPVNIDTLSQFVSQVMVIFLICVQSRLSN